MNDVRRYLAIAMLTVAGCTQSGSSPYPTRITSTPAPTATATVAPADLANPPEVASVHGIASLTLTAMIDPKNGAPALSYAGAFVAPTIRVYPGDTIDLTYVNALPASSAEPFNDANLHFHGFSSSPEAPGDDSIGTVAMPGQTLHYQVVVPKTQPPGVYLYHSHAHGEADWQVANGMVGAIVVSGVASYAPETAGLVERVMVLRNLLTAPSYSQLYARRRSSRGTASSVCSEAWTNQYTTINGSPVGSPILMQPGRSQLWRIVNASSDGYYDLSVDGESLRVVSLDGVPIASYPGAQAMTVSNLVIPPAGRADVIVRGPASGSAAFRTTCTDTGISGSPNPPQVLGTITAGLSKLPVVPPASAAALAKGTYETAIGSPSVQRTLNFTENPDTAQYYLNKALYDPSGAPMFTAQSGTVEEWTLNNYTFELHAFHIHQVHFIVLDVDGVAQPPMWRDTVNLPYQHADGSPSVTHVLIDFRDPAVRGTFLFHCHLLKHEDGGMMAKILVQ